MKPIESLHQYAETIRMMERGAFLHDLDKGDEHFLDKPVWHTLNDKPLAEQWAEKQQRWQNLLGDCNPEIPNPGLDYNQLRVLVKDVDLGRQSFGNLSSPFVCHHLDPAEGEKVTLPLAGLIVHAGGCGADGIDSEMDKVPDNQGKKLQIQKDRPFKIATPFRRDVDTWDNSGRQEIVERIKNGGALRDCQSLMSRMLGETRIPYNDVTLWDHSFQVAAISKSITAKIIAEYHAGIRDAKNHYIIPWRGIKNFESKKLESELDKEVVNEYGSDKLVDLYKSALFLLGYIKIEYDLDFLLGRAHTAADLANSLSDLNRVMDEIRDFYENTLLPGNEMYRDHRRQLFIYPVLHEQLNADWEQELERLLKEKLRELLTKHNLQELPFTIAFQPMQTDATMGAELIKAAGKLTGENALTQQDPSLLLSLAQNLHPGRICDLCNMRSATGKPWDNVDHLCSSCEKRRNRFRQEAGPMNTFSLQDLTRSQENKLAFFSISLCLDKLRDGSLFAADAKTDSVKVQPSPGRISRSYNVTLNFFHDFLENKVPVYAKNGYFRIILSQERLDFVVAAAVADELLTAFQQAHKEAFELFQSTLPARMAIIFFYQKYPLYAVIDAAGNMIHALNPGEFDFMLLDSSAQRFAFFRKERAHHILPVARRYQIESDAPRFQRLWETLNKLPKSQISAIEEFLVDKMLSWPEEIRRRDPGTFRNLCHMSLFDPNALQKIPLSQEQQTEILDAAEDGTLLDVIELFIHLENKK